MPAEIPTARGFDLSYFVGYGPYSDGPGRSGHSGQESLQRERSEIGRRRTVGDMRAIVSPVEDLTSETT